MNRTMGYIIQSGLWKGNAVKLEDDGLLWHSDVGTLFGSYNSARNALRRTATYARKHNMVQWQVPLWKIQRVVSE